MKEFIYLLASPLARHRRFQPQSSLEYGWGSVAPRGAPLGSSGVGRQVVVFHHFIKFAFYISIWNMYLISASLPRQPRSASVVEGYKRVKEGEYLQYVTKFGIRNISVS